MFCSFREAKKKHVQLIKDRRVFEHRIGEMEEQCNSMMMQKFGRIVDLEKLETVTVNRQVEELKEKMRVNEIQCSNELLKWEVRGVLGLCCTCIFKNSVHFKSQSFMVSHMCW